MGNINTERLTSCRLRCGYSQKYVAISVGVAPSVVSRWETGLKNPSRDNIAKLASLYSVSTDYLLGISEEMTSSNTMQFTTMEIQLVFNYRKLNEQNKINIQNNIQFLLNQQNEEKDMHSITTA